MGADLASPSTDVIKSSVTDYLQTSEPSKEATVVTATSSTIASPIDVKNLSSTFLNLYNQVQIIVLHNMTRLVLLNC